MPKNVRNILIFTIVQFVISLLDAVLHWRAFVLLFVAVTLVTICSYLAHFMLGPQGLAYIRAQQKKFKRYVTKRAIVRYVIGIVWISAIVCVLGLAFRQHRVQKIVHAAFEGTPTHTPPPTPTATPPPTLIPTLIPTRTPLPTATLRPTPTPIFHVIQEGENPWCISMAYYHTGALWGLICKANIQFSSLEECAENLRVGNELWIPTKQDFPQSPIPDPLPIPWVRGKDYICEPEEGSTLEAPLTSEQ